MQGADVVRLIEGAEFLFTNDHATRSLRGMPPLLLLDPDGGAPATRGPVSAVAPEYARPTRPKSPP